MVLIHLVNQNLENTVIIHILHIDLNIIQLYVLFHVNILKLIFRLNITLIFFYIFKNIILQCLCTYHVYVYAYAAGPFACGTFNL